MPNSKETIWLDEAPTFIIDGSGVLFVRGHSAHNVRISHSSFRAMVERGIRELNAFDAEVRCKVVPFRRVRE